MRKVPETGRRKVKPASVFAVSAASILSVAVVFNAFMGQGAPQRIPGDIPEGATTRMDVEVPASGNTIQLKYDPLIEDTQRQLLATGYYKGIIDGVLGRKTRNAIAEYQKSAGMTVTGEPTPDLVEHIRFTRQVSEASLFTGSLDQTKDAELRASIRRVQTGLAELAYSPGEISGEITAQTRAAILAFQRDRHLAETGEIGPELSAELAKMSGQTDLAGQ